MNTKFSKDVINFLMNYQPVDPHFTSKEEIVHIGYVLNLIDKDAATCQDIRNNVVMFYSNLMDNEIMYDENGKYNGRTEQFWNYQTAMMSITAAIDYFMYV